MAGSRSPTLLPCRDAAWLAVLAMLCQLLVPALSPRHHAALTFELAEATGRHHGHRGDPVPREDPAGCLVHMALCVGSSPPAAPPPALPLRLASAAVERPRADLGIGRDSRRWRPQSVRAPPRSTISTI
ncbi:MAG TPA: hypothetical protein PKA13_21780 [Geminicoccaceae bacterium]|nr:hypothetical protein [Geminicoccaceae bacterium]